MPPLRPTYCTFKVTAPRFSEFPLDMLRFGRCWPTGTEDANMIARTMDRTSSYHGPEARKPTISLTMVEDAGWLVEISKRFSSFGWTVWLADERTPNGCGLLNKDEAEKAEAGEKPA